MYHQKSTETVTLTKTQLQAILELITKIGGIGVNDNANTSVEAWEDPRLQFNSQRDVHLQNNSKSIQFGNCIRNELRDQKRVQWENERKELSSQDHWFSLRNDRFKEQYDRSHMRNDPQLMIPLTPPSPSPISISPSNSSGGGDPIRSAMPVSSPPNYRRYAYINNAEVNFNELEEKRLKMMKYQQELESQRREKERRKREEKERTKMEENRLERRIKEQQLTMQREFQIEQQRLREKQEIAERKRAAVISAIEKTPILNKKNLSYHSESYEKDRDNDEFNETHALPIVAVLPQKMGNKNSSKTNGNAIVMRDQCDVGVQTDFQLLFRWFCELRDLMSDKSDINLSNTFETETGSSNSSSISAPSSPTAKYKKFTDNIPQKVPFNHADHKNMNNKKPEWGVNRSNKTYLKNTDKDPNRKFQEMRRKYWERESQQRSKKRVQNDRDYKITKNKSDGDDQIRLKSAVNHDTVRRRSFSPKSAHADSRPPFARSSSPPIPTLQSKSSEHGKSTFLPDIRDMSMRPQSRKKWHSQETFYPMTMTESND